jgi:dipeptide transport system permease protein
MLAIFLKKVLHSLPTIVGISILSFLLVRLVPGDPVLLLLGERGGNPEVYREMKKNLGLDLPWPVQYVKYMKGAVQGDLGTSIISKRSVTEEFLERFPATLELGVCALFWATILGIPLGIIAALKRNSFLDYLLMGGSLVGYSMPIFWWGPMLILLFSVGLGWTPVAGRMSVMFDVDAWSGFMLIDTLQSSVIEEEGFAPFWNALKHLILPSVAMGTIPLATFARMSRSSMLEVLGEEFIKTAKARGIKTSRIILVHGLRNALIPLITVAGLMFGSIITGAILTETIFSWPGIGKWMVASINSRDYPVIQGGILVIAAMIIFINAFVEILYAWANPKMRSQV